MSSTSLFSISKDFSKNLTQVNLKDIPITPYQIRNNTFVKLTITTKGFKMVAFQTEGKDDNGDSIRISIYNLPSTGTAGTINIACNLDIDDYTNPDVSSLFQVGTIIYIRDPWVKYAMDGNIAMRVEDSKDIAFVKQVHCCNSCQAANVKLLRCGKCSAAFYCNAECQKKDWTRHKKVCISYERNQQHHNI